MLYMTNLFLNPFSIKNGLNKLELNYSPIQCSYLHRKTEGRYTL